MESVNKDEGHLSVNGPCLLFLESICHSVDFVLLEYELNIDFSIYIDSPLGAVTWEEDAKE